MIENAQESAVEESSDGGKLTTVGVFLLIGGVVLGVGGIAAQTQGDETRDWNVVEGRIISSELVSRTKVRNNAFSGHKQISDRYRADVAFEYTLDGQSFTSNRVSSFDQEYPLLSQGQEIVDRYPLGKTVQVYYRSDNPETAMLDIATNQHVSMQLGLGALCLGLGAVLAIAGRF